MTNTALPDLYQQTIGVKEAVQKARQYFMDVFADEELKELRLEEVLLSEDESTWDITFGYDTDSPVEEIVQGEGDANPLGVLSSLYPRWRPPKYVRVYKQVKLRASDGALVGISIRKL